MATYLQGVQDAVQGLRPPDPNLQFDAQLLATRQAKYDQAHSKLSKMYGTILNAGLTRDDNIAAREEFFKLIDSDLHKIAGMDLSKESNVSKAQNVFKQIYENDYLVKDMVWTKHYQNQMQRAEEFKACKNAEDCGGLYWEDGVKYMQYKREEFKNANQDESLSFSNVDYIPNNNLLANAIEDFKKIDPDAKAISYTPDGKYRITYTNGKVIEKPLTDFFNQLYSRDPRFMDMYKVMAYNQRKDEIYASIAEGKYKNLNDATVGYIETYRSALQEDFDKRHEEITHDYDQLKSLSEAYAKDIEEGRIQQFDKTGKITEEYKLASQTEELFFKAENLKKWNDNVIAAQKNLHHQSKREYITDYMDNLNAMSFFNAEVNLASQTLSNLTAQEEVEPDEYAFEDYQFKHKQALAAQQFEYDRELAEIEAGGKAAEFRGNAYQAAKELQTHVTEVKSLQSSLYTASAQKVIKELGDNVDIPASMTKEQWKILYNKLNKSQKSALLRGMDLAMKDLVLAKQKANGALIKTLDYASRYGPNLPLTKLGITANTPLYLKPVTLTSGTVLEVISPLEAEMLGKWTAQYKGMDGFTWFNDAGIELMKSPYKDAYKTGMGIK